MSNKTLAEAPDNSGRDTAPPLPTAPRKVIHKNGQLIKIRPPKVELSEFEVAILKAVKAQPGRPIKQVIIPLLDLRSFTCLRHLLHGLVDRDFLRLKPFGRALLVYPKNKSVRYLENAEGLECAEQALASHGKGAV